MRIPRFFISCLQLMVVAISMESASSQVNYTVLADQLIVTDDGYTAGPSFSLSGTVLEEGNILHYRCIAKENVNNSLAVLTDAGAVEIVEESLHVDGKILIEACRVGDPSSCTITTGNITWRRSLGNRYCCSAHPEKSYYVHWINPDAVYSSEDQDLSSNYSGGTVMLKCGVDMTPTDISYEGVLEFSWRFVGSASGSLLTNLAESSTVSWGLEPRGPNSSLTITDFNPIKHGGEYQCFGKMLRYSKTLLGPRFKIWSKPSAKLKNNKRREFRFGKYESNVKFTCEGLSYPFPEKIEFRLQANVVNEHTKGVTHYEVDRIGLNVDRLTATFTVANMSEVFTNGSLLDCTVWRREGDLEVTSQQRVILVGEDPPIDVTTPEGEITLPPHVSPGKGDSNGSTTSSSDTGKLKPWIVAVIVIVPFLILLVIIVLLVWKCRNYYNGDSGDYRIGKTDDDDDD